MPGKGRGPRQTQGNPQHPKLLPELPNWGKHLRLPGKLCKKFAVLFKERINWGAQTNAKIITATPQHSHIFFSSLLMLPQLWTNSIQLVASKELCPHKVKSCCSSWSTHWMLWEIVLSFCTSFRSKLTFWSTPVKGVGYSLFSLIFNVNPKKRVVTAFELLHKCGRFSYPTLVFPDFLYLRGLYLPKVPSHWNRLFLCGKCWGGEIDTRCKRNNQRSSTAWGSSGLRVLAELTQLTIHTGKEYLQSLKNFIWKQRGNKGQ